MAKPPRRSSQRPDSGIICEGLLRTELADPQELSSFAKSARLETIMPQLYDAESSYSEPEKPLPVDLGLDQIEDY